MCYFLCLKYYLIISVIISWIIVYFIKKRVLVSNNMSALNVDDQLSDDEVFFGKLTLKELKKHILWDKYPEQTSASAHNSPKQANEQCNTSLKILEAHSQPNLICDREKPDKMTNLDFNSSECDEPDSFIKMEDMVAKLCVSPNNTEKTEGFDNTLEVIEYILNNPPNGNKDKNNENHNKPTDDAKPLLKNCQDNLNVSIENLKIKNDEYMDSPEPPQNTPVKSAHKPFRHLNVHSGHTTPRDMKPKPVFKTPAQPLSIKKASATSLKKTPSRSNAYEHISSPVASYIKNCPIAPLVKDIHPKKPLPGPSSIPKLVKNPLTQSTVKKSNKENVNLPSVAYKSAKKTKVIDMPDEYKLPQSQWAKKIMTTLPKPMVMKHDHRELNFAKKKLMSHNEDSFADLSYHQAEVSVCTQKSAFKINKNL